MSKPASTAVIVGSLCKASFSRKVAQALIAQAPATLAGWMGAFVADHALRQTFVFLNLLVMQQPEAYIGGVGEFFDEAGALTSGETSAFFDKFLAAFDAWVKRFAAVPGRDH